MVNLNNPDGLFIAEQSLREFDRYGDESAKRLIMCNVSGVETATALQSVIDRAASLSHPIIFYDAKNPTNPRVAELNQLVASDNKKFYDITETDPCMVMRQLASQVQTQEVKLNPSLSSQVGPKTPGNAASKS